MVTVFIWHYKGKLLQVLAKLHTGYCYLQYKCRAQMTCNFAGSDHFINPVAAFSQSESNSSSPDMFQKMLSASQEHTEFPHCCIAAGLHQGMTMYVAGSCQMITSPRKKETFSPRLLHGTESGWGLRISSDLESSPDRYKGTDFESSTF
jgi:hypothetical protein